MTNEWQFGLKYVQNASFFEEDNGEAISVNGDRYRAMVYTFLREKVENNCLEDYWFQKDGDTAHTARLTINLLNKMFPGHLVSRTVMLTGRHLHQIWLLRTFFCEDI